MIPRSLWNDDSPKVFFVLADKPNGESTIVHVTAINRDMAFDLAVKAYPNLKMIRVLF